MNKQALIVPSHVKNEGPVTRAKAATLASHGKTLLPKPPLIPDKKQTKVGRTKRVISEENNHAAPYVVTSQNKKRAVLKDVSNVYCESSYRKCTNEVKIQAKACKLQVRPQKLKAKASSDRKDLKYGGGNGRKCRVPVPENLSGRGNSFTTAELDGTMQGETKTEGCVMDGIHDIDLDLSNPQMCCLYAIDIYTNLRSSERIRRISSTYMELQREITQSMRGILIDWLVEVADEYKLVPDTLYLSVYAIDSFLSGNYIERQRLQLLGVTCMLIASKYEEICAPPVEEFCFITDNTYTKEDVLKMEVQVLSYLDFRLSVPTIKTFLRRFLRAAQASYNVPSLPLGYMANYLSELTLVEYSFLKFLPSVIAASAVFLARWTLDQSDQPWTCTLEHYTLYKALDLKPAVLQMHDLQQNSSKSPLSAVRDKYIQEKYEQVACRVSPKLPDSLFY